MTDELIVTGYCRKTDMSRVIVCEPETDENGETVLYTDCFYPECEFSETCKLIERLRGEA